jgi:hypothetical protein
MTDQTLTIRRSQAADSRALARLAALDSSSPLTGPSLIAEVGREVWAAVDIGSGSAIADPFRPSGDLVALLRLRAESVRGAQAAERRGLTSLLPRAA